MKSDPFSVPISSADNLGQIAQSFWAPFLTRKTGREVGGLDGDDVYTAASTGLAPQDVR